VIRTTGFSSDSIVSPESGLMDKNDTVFPFPLRYVLDFIYIYIYKSKGVIAMGANRSWARTAGAGYLLMFLNKSDGLSPIDKTRRRYIFLKRCDGNLG
jgi:hypothetical protein